MAHVGTIDFDIRIRGVKSALASFEKGMKASIQKASQAAQANMPKLTAQLEKGGQKATMSFSAPFKQLKPVIQQQTKRAIGVIERFQKRVATLSRHIEHYLSFTIGVQLVMRSIRAVQTAIETVSNFQRAVVNATAVSGYLGAAFDDVSKRLGNLSRSLGRKTVYSAMEVAEAMYSVASAGYDVGKITEQELLPILNYAAATQTDLAYATESVIKTAKQFGMTLEDTGRIVDVFVGAITTSFETSQRLAEGLKYTGQIAGTLGVSLEDTVAALSVLVNKGYEGAQAGQRLNMALTKLLKPSSEGEKVLKRLGLTIGDLDPNVYSLTDILYKLKAAGFDAADASTMFRARTAAAIVTLVKSADDIARFSKQLELTGGITQALADKQMNTLWGSIKTLQNAIQDFYLELSDFLIPAVGGVASFIRSVLLPSLKALLTPLIILGKVMKSLGPIGAALKNTLMSFGVAIAGLIISLKLLSIVLGEQLTAGFYKALIGSKTLIGGWKSLAVLAGGLAASMVAMASASDNLAAKVAVAVIAITEMVWAMHALTAASSTAKTAIGGLLGPIGLIIAVGSVIYTVFQEQINEALGNFGEWLGIIPSEADKVQSSVKKLIPYYYELADSMEDAYDAQKQLIEAQREYNEAVEEGKVSTDIIERLNWATHWANETEQDFMKTVTQMIKIMGDSTEGVNKYLSSYQKLVDTQTKMKSAQEDLDRIQSEITQAQEEYNNAVLRHGAVSEEATNALSKLQARKKEEERIRENLYRLTEDEINLKAELKKQYNDLEDAEKQLADSGKTLIDVAADYIDKLTQLNSLTAEANALRSLQTNWEKLFTERAEQLLEIQTKIYEIESKLYKLRQDLADRSRDVWDALAKEGMLTEDLIEKRKEMELSQGKAMKTQVAYSKLFNKLTSDQRDALTDWVEGYINAMKAGEEYRAPIPVALSPEDYDVVMDYVSAQYDLWKSTGMLSGSLQDVVGDLVENGQVSAEVAEAYYELLSLTGDIAKAENDLSDAQDEASNNYAGMLRVIWNLLRSYQDETGEIYNLKSAYLEVIDALGIWSDSADNERDILNEINSLLGTHYKSLSDIREEDFVVAASMAALGQTYSTLYNTIATQDIQSLLPDETALDGFKSALETAAVDISDPIATIVSQINTIKEALDDLPETKIIEIVLDKKTRGEFEKEASKTAADIIKETGDYLNQTLTRKLKESEVVKRAKPAEISYTSLAPKTKEKIDKIFKGVDNISGSLRNALRRSGAFGIGGVIKAPTFSMLGEAGPELVLPLKNMRRTRYLLQRYLPSYAPEMAAQLGGLYGAGAQVTISGGETYRIEGPIYIEQVSDVDSFLDQLKFRARAAAPV